MSDAFEQHIQHIAQNLPYPPTPPLRKGVARRQPAYRLRYAVVALLIMGFSGLLIPDIRAAIVDFLNIGAVTIYLDGTNAEGDPLDLGQVSGETTLAAAQRDVDFTLLAFPDDPADRVFVQNDLVIFVWITGNEIEKALYQTADESWQIVKTVDTIVETHVRDYAAYWVSVPHPVEFYYDDEIQREWTQLVTGKVLGWAQDGITYRLETDLSLDDARALAESLVPLP